MAYIPECANNRLAAAALMITRPALVLTAITQRQIAAGLTAGVVKGE
jgi:ABC-type maltose transport system permease subunit